MSDGLDKEGGISFGRKLNETDKKKPYGLAEPKDEVDVEEPKRLDTEDLLKQERLNAQLSKAKTINYSGFAFNGGSIVGLLFVIDNFIFDPTTLELLDMMFNKTLGLDIDFPNIINLMQEYKTQLIGACISMQTMLMGYKDTVQKMRDRGNESFTSVLNEELGKVI